MSSKFKEFEQAGFSVTVVNSKGQVVYSTERNESSEYCDSCKCLAFAPDPDPNDWFRGDDQMAICTATNAVIARQLEYNELTNIRKPLFCPKLGRKLTDEEIEEAKKSLKSAKKL